jgi:hypothetical protein
MQTVILCEAGLAAPGEHLYSCVDSSGARQALPMVVAPEAIRRGVLQPFIDSNIFLPSSPFILGGLHVSSLLPLYIFPLFLSQL